MNDNLSLPISNESSTVDHPRMCLACGYNLYGLGKELRCPECGLVNLPDNIRRQTWEFVDARSWFFSSMFQLFKKRPAGWWWALDREDDVRRSVRLLLKNIILTIVMVIFGSLLVHACLVVETSHYSSFLQGKLDSSPLYEATYVQWVGPELTYIQIDNSVELIDWKQLYDRNRTLIQRRKLSFTFQPSWTGITWNKAYIASLWIILIWAGPALVGLYTQIRKGLPAFAVAPRTITAAANYESHRMIYLCMLFWLYCVIEVIVRWQAISTPNWSIYYNYMTIIPVPLSLIGAAGWIGPLRTDYTKQLIRSRSHAIRIVIMYAVIFPLFCTGTIYLFVANILLSTDFN